MNENTKSVLVLTVVALICGTIIYAIYLLTS